MVDGILPLGNVTTMMNALPALGARGIDMAAHVESAAQDFEAMFASQMLKPMFDTVPVNSMFGGGNGEEVMRSFLLQEYGKIIAKTGMLGLGTQVKAEMLRAQESAKAKGAKLTSAKAENAYAGMTAAATAAEGTTHVAHR